MLNRRKCEAERGKRATTTTTTTPTPTTTTVTYPCDFLQIILKARRSHLFELYHNENSKKPWSAELEADITEAWKLQTQSLADKHAKVRQKGNERTRCASVFRVARSRVARRRPDNTCLSSALSLQQKRLPPIRRFAF